SIAAAAAAAGERVLLIDTDLRKPSVERLFGLASRHGLTDILIGDADLSTAAVWDESSNAYILTSGIKTNVGSAELLRSKRMEALLQKAVADFDLVVLDGP